MRLQARRFLPALFAALLAAGCAHPDGPKPDGHPTSSAQAARSLAWGPCDWEHDFLAALGPDRAAAFQQGFELGCASVEVPLDHEAASKDGGPDGSAASNEGPDGQHLRISLSRTRPKGVAAQDPGGKNRRPLLTNFGGPGEPGARQAAALALRAKDDLGARFDIIGFDPRGTGGSDPVLCGPDPAKEAQQPILDARDPAQLAKLRERISAVAQDCEAKLGPKLAQFNTYQTAQDIEAIRAALGVDQIDYLGYSYGTFLGATYAHLHPKQLHAIVLDAPVDLRRDPVKTEEETISAREKAFNSFLDWTKTQPGYADLGNGRGFLAQAFLDPGAGQLLAGISALLSSPSRWPDLAEGLRTVMSTGDSAALRKADPGLSMANWAVLCNDLPQDRRPDDAAVQRLATEWEQKYPTFGRYELGYGNSLATGCAGWPAPAHPVAPNSIDFASGPKPLVVGGETDPVTPLAWAVPFAQAVGGELLVTAEPGHGHYLRAPARGAKGCVDQAVDDYLALGKLPPDGTRCPTN
ncbi:MAG: alpha/beta hydrolase [Segniliparus sp.]|uniref:alpha/beta hydrolase n=1 Tax=Segniliparus sp. TaxID=2804064 RepID=UPI003F2CE299